MTPFEMTIGIIGIAVPSLIAWKAYRASASSAASDASMVESEKAKTQEASRAASKADMRIEVERPGVSDDAASFITLRNDGPSMARCVVVLVDGIAMVEHEDYIDPKPSRETYEPGSSDSYRFFSMYYRTVRVMWSDDSGEPGIRSKSV